MFKTQERERLALLTFSGSLRTDEIIVLLSEKCKCRKTFNIIRSFKRETVEH